MDYQKQAKDFLDKTGTAFKAEFKEYRKYFPGDKEARDVYEITLSRNGREHTFNFGQSIAASGKWWKYGDYRHGVSHAKIQLPRYEWDRNKDFAAPTPYDVLACLTKYDPGTFENFCAEFGYNEDSRAAERVYKAVKAEFEALQRLYSDAELEKMAEIV